MKNQTTDEYDTSEYKDVRGLSANELEHSQHNPVAALSSANLYTRHCKQLQKYCGRFAVITTMTVAVVSMSAMSTQALAGDKWKRIGEPRVTCEPATSYNNGHRQCKKTVTMFRVHKRCKKKSGPSWKDIVKLARTGNPFSALSLGNDYSFCYGKRTIKRWTQ